MKYRALYRIMPCLMSMHVDNNVQYVYIYKKVYNLKNRRVLFYKLSTFLKTEVQPTHNLRRNENLRWIHII